MRQRGYQQGSFKHLPALIIITFVLLLPLACLAQDFTARTINSYGDITVMEVEGNYDAETSGGSTNAAPRAEIAKEFFKTHADDYDFLVIFSAFDFKMPAIEVEAFYLGVKNDTLGIGIEPFDNTDFFGSTGRLQGTIDMGNIAKTSSDPLDTKFTTTMGILSHELLHRWAAHVRFRAQDGTTSSALLGRGGYHWSFLLDTQGSLLYGNRWQANGDGTFTSLPGWKYYSPLDLYLMGLRTKSDVPPMLLIEAPGIDPNRLPQAGVTITGQARTVTIDDIIAVEGERIPAVGASPKAFKAAFILVTRPGTFDETVLNGIRAVMKNWAMWVSGLTDGRAIVQLDSSPLPEIPTNPGTPPPTVDPRTAPPEVNDGVDWLIDHQQEDGSWLDSSQTAERDTTEAVLALLGFPSASSSLTAGRGWLKGVSSITTDYLARRIEALSFTGDDVVALLNELFARQNADGGWGSKGRYASNPLDTSLALRALAAAGYTDKGVIEPAITYLKARQNQAGGWGGADNGGSIQATANTLQAFTRYLDAYNLTTEIQRGLAWLMARQNPDGGFGNTPSTVYETALAVITLKAYNASTDVTNKGMNYILQLQDKDGSWYKSPYQTALAVRAIWRMTGDPDLAVTTADITFTPTSVTKLPAVITVNAKVANLGLTAVPQATIAFYDGAIAQQNKVGEQQLAVAGKSTVTTTFTITISDGNAHRLYIAVDPEGLVQESSETNNTALKVLYPETTYDFEILPGDVTVTPNPIDIFQTVTISARVTNLGTTNAYNVPVRYYLNTTGGPVDMATLTVDIPAGGTVERIATWQTDRAGTGLIVTAQADPSSAFAEISEENNTASTQLTIVGSTKPNLTVSYKDISVTPSPAMEGQGVHITAQIKNTGFSAAENCEVRFLKGSPGTPLSSQVIPSLGPGESTSIAADWIAIAESGERLITIQIDPENLISEISEEDNSAFVTLQILSLPDLAISTNSITFNPPAPKDGDQVAIQVTVQNAGSQGTANITVTVADGTNAIGSSQIPSIAGNAAEAITFVYDTAGKSGPHNITVVVDPDNTIAEQSEDNNTASRSFGVQEADLWVTEQYISPNGDGVQDSTQFFFRLKTAQTVKVIIRNEKNESVRTYTGTQFVNTGGGNVTWDGKDDKGVVVTDGAYQFQVVDTKGALIATLPVIVDTNRSPLTKAIGTPYLLQRNLTCMLPDIGWQWFPDESGIAFYIQYGSSEYPNGLYTMGPDGEDIQRLVPWEWRDDSTYQYFYNYALSPDGEKIAFILTRYINQKGIIDLTQLWVVDRDGRNLLLIDARNWEQQQEQLSGMHWSPDSLYINYEVYKEAGYLHQIWFVRSDGTGKKKIDELFDFLPEGFQWSSDGKRLAYYFYYYDENGNFGGEIRITDIDGNYKDIFETDQGIQSITWLDTDKIVASLNSSTWLVDTTGGGNHIKVGDQSFAVIIRPNHKEFALLETNYQKWSIKVCDDTGKCQIIREAPMLGELAVLYDLQWSPDGTKLAFVDYLYEKVGECKYNGYLVIIDMETKEKQAFKVETGINPCGGGESFHISTQEEGTWIERGIFHYDSDYKTRELDLSKWFNDAEATYRIRITQEGMDAAHVDYLALAVDGIHYVPNKAINITTGNDILYKISSQDNDVTDAHDVIIELQWDNVLQASNISLVMHAREEDLSKRASAPFRYPIAGYYPVRLVQGSSIEPDGRITAEDDLPEPLFAEYTRPITGHPDGYTYGYVKSDGVYLYGVLDFTSDNTLDNGRDWASIEVITPMGVKTFLVNDAQQDYGTTTLTYTDKVNYEHKVYEFKIPLDEIGTQTGDTINIAFTAYGTAGGSSSEEHFDSGSLRWFTDVSLIAQAIIVNSSGYDTYRLFTINAEDGKRAYLPPSSYYYQSINISPLGRYLTYYQGVPQNSACYGRGSQDLWAMSSLLNLTADLRIVKSKSSLVLKGIAADLNFAGYKLEYADVKSPKAWNLVTPPSNVPVLDDVFTSWVPPYEGTFYVKLTVWDKAGNVLWKRKRASWGLFSSITNLYKTEEIFSPSGDGVKDTVELRYRALEPVHLEFFIYDEAGNLVRTFFKDHSEPEEGFITWDGKDEEGRIVPDGIYRMQVFDYEFFVQVDNTPPEVLMGITPLQSFDLAAYKPGNPHVYADLLGRAVDPHIQQWIVEYGEGEGENPQEWTQYKSGSSSIQPLDENGNPLLGPTTIDTFVDENIVFIAGKRFRITAEDLAGNKSTAISDFLEEAVLLYKCSKPNPLFAVWDDLYIQFSRNELGQIETTKPIMVIPPEYTKPPGKLWGLETFRLPITKVYIQYHVYDPLLRRMQWVDYANPLDPAGNRIFSMAWDMAGLDPATVYAARLKAVDTEGKMHFSNAVSLQPIFTIIVSCMGNYAKNLLLEDLKLLKFQVKSEQDTRYREWTDYQVYDKAKGQEIPMGTIDPLPLPTDLQQGVTYQLRMIGTGQSGTPYKSNIADYPPKDCLILSLNIEYEQANRCDALAPGQATISAEVTVPVVILQAIQFKSLSFYMQETEEFRLLRQLDLAGKSLTIKQSTKNYVVISLGSVIVNTSAMPEGGYPVKAVLEYIQDDTAQEIENKDNPPLTLVVDRVLPLAQITYPTGATQVCPVKITAPCGSWFAIQVEGLATDDKKVGYALYYGSGEEPSSWIPALKTDCVEVADGVERKSNNITGGAVQGRLGSWDVTDLTGDTFSLMLKVRDSVGNLSCHTTTFSMDTAVHPAVSTDKRLFSPNGDGKFDDLAITYTVDEYATIDIKAFKAQIDGFGNINIITPAVRKIVSGQAHLPGTETTSWDGKADDGSTVPDGLYRLIITATDACGNIAERSVDVEVDNTSPTTAITYPLPGDPLGIIVEVKGTAQDPHFASYQLIVEETSALIGQGTAPCESAVLGTWNNYGQEGSFTLKLTATDTVGNKGETQVTINLGERKDLIKDVKIDPPLFSPNNDSKLESTTVQYELAYPSDIAIEIFDANQALKKSYTALSQAAGIHTYVWNGTDNQAQQVPAGAYTIRLTATLTAQPDAKQSETISVVVDATPPTVVIQDPIDKSYAKGTLLVKGTITDQHLSTYKITYAGENGSGIVNEGNQNRTDYAFATLTEADIVEGTYTLEATATDQGEIITKKASTFTIDRTLPKLALQAPLNGEFYGFDKGTIQIKGTIEEKNLDVYTLRYGASDNPTAWTTLVTGANVPTLPDLYSWTVGKQAGIPDGLYTLSLYAKDKAGWESEVKVKITIDNTLPVVSITSPVEGGYVKESMDIKGTAFDQNLDTYTVEIAPGECASSYKWTQIKQATTSVQNGVLAPWKTLPPDGAYCLRVTAVDKLKNSAEARHGVIVDTQPPTAPVLSGQVENKKDARLSWTRNTEPDLAGYNLYRDAKRVNTTLLPDVSYLDQGLTEGTYGYTVKAQDRAGWESIPSNKVELKIDTTPPEARIRLPQDGGVVSDIIDIKGTAYSVDDFKEYRVSIGQGTAPTAWTTIRQSPIPTTYDTLAQWDTMDLMADQYAIKLEAEDLAGNIAIHQITVRLDNAPPAAPVLLTATASGSTVTLSWQANTEADLAGYLLYRNGQLANVTGTVVGDLKPYLITGTSYTDTGLPDGQFTYFLVAMDQASNESEQSNTKEITIDTHPPKAQITAPADGYRFDAAVIIKAESPDLDIATVQFQYKKAAAGTWTNLGSAVATQPFVTRLDPAALGWSDADYGDYNLQAVARDKGGNMDPAPTMIKVTYTDITPPAAPQALKALTDGGDVALSWQANTEPDLAGYNIYKVTGQTKTKLNTTLISTAAYQVPGLADGTYAFEVTAVDRYSNESTPSAQAQALIYTLVITQPYTPIAVPQTQVQGSKAAANSSVEFFLDTGGGPVVQGQVTADDKGAFAFTVSLALGENRITARAKDAQGNKSKISNSCVVLYDEPPAQPTGLAATVSARNVTLTWNPNTEADLAGYNLFRDSQKVNTALPVTTGTTSASYNSSISNRAFDNNTSTYWVSDYLYRSPGYQWWQVEFASPTLISRMEIEWSSPAYSYAAWTYEIQVWSGNLWITQARVTANQAQVNTFDFKPSYRSKKIRIYITAAVSGYVVRLSEVRIWRDNLITATSYQDLNLPDGEHTYQVMAVDYYGFESPLSAPATAAVGDVMPPAPPQGLTATASGSAVNLAWSANQEPDLASYNIYKKVEQAWNKINGSLVTSATYTDPNLPNGTYTYRVTAIDQIGNESGPSNEDSAQVQIEPLPRPTNVNIAPVPEGRALTICWENAGSNVAGYNLYRSTTPGNHYERINTALITDLCFLDDDLVNGTTYYYVVTAVDALGNESVYSEQAFAIPADVVAPAAPSLFYPTISTIPVTLYTATTAISGFSEPGATVRLFHNGSQGDTALALAEDHIQRFTISDFVEAASVSPDTKTLAYNAYDYTNNSISLWLQDLATGSTSMIVSNAFLTNWSPDSTRIAYEFEEENWNFRIGLYNRGTGTASLLTEDTGADEYYLNWIQGKNRLAFISNRGGTYDVWVKDFDTGALTKVTNGVEMNWSWVPLLSPNGQRLAYTQEQTLSVVDLATGASQVVDSQLPQSFGVVAWAPDSARLAFVSGKNGSPDIYVMDMKTQKIEQLTATPETESWFWWSPDGQALVTGIYTDTYEEAWVIPAKAGKQGRLLLHAEPFNLRYLEWLPNGFIAYMAGSELSVVQPQGLFTFPDVALQLGENAFTAVATDAAGNTSPASEPITVIYETSRLADLEALSEDIVIYPAAPLVGDKAAITIPFRNKGAVAAENVVAEVYVLDSAGYLELVKYESFSTIDAHEEKQLSFTWDTANRTGQNMVMVLLDAENRVLEASEENNFATKQFYVAESEGITFTASLDAAQYPSNKQVYITVQISNSGPAMAGTLDVWIEDEQGVKVAQIATKDVQLPYGKGERYDLIWNTGKTYAGAYRLRAVLKGATAVLAETTIPFTIEPSIAVASSVVTDKASYGPNEEVQAGITVTNNGQNYTIPLLKVRIQITRSDGAMLLSQDQEIRDLLPNASSSLSASWNTGLELPGDYEVKVEVSLADQVVSSSTAQFSITSSAILTGQLTITPAIVNLGEQVKAGYTVVNSGSAAVGSLMLRVICQDPESQAVVASHEETIVLNAGQQHTGEIAISTAGLAIKGYRVILQGVQGGKATTLASASFTIRDGTPPIVKIVSPASGSVIRAAFSLAIQASDNASGVAQAEYEVDGGVWHPLPLVDPTTGTYATTWQPVAGDEGTHTISSRASDRAGNASEPVSVSITIELETPFERLTGTIAASPNPVYRGQEASFLCTLNNSTDTLITGLTVRVLIIDPKTNETKMTLEKTGTVPPKGSATGNLTASTAALLPQVYHAQLQVVSAAAAPRILASTSFEVVPSITVTEALADPTNLLVWVNDNCHRKDDHEGHGQGADEHDDSGEDDQKGHDEDHDGKGDDKGKGSSREQCDHPEHCIRIDLLEQLLTEAGVSYLIVSDKRAFEHELRNPYYTDILILGDHEPLTDHVADELQEQVYSGTGICSSLWLMHGKGIGIIGQADNPLFGVRYKGKLPGDHHRVTTIESPITEQGTFDTLGKAERVEAAADTTIAGWLDQDKQKGHVHTQHCHHDNPAIVMHQYGLGKAIYFAFDLGLTLTDKNYAQMALLIKNSIAHCHRTPEAATFYPLQFIPIDLQVKDQGAGLEVQIQEQFAPGLFLYDPVAGAWVTESPWITTMQLEPNQTATMRYYALTPDRAGAYTIETDIGFLAQGNAIPCYQSALELIVPKDASVLTADIIAALEALASSKKDRLLLNLAIMHVKQVKRVKQDDKYRAQTIAMNIHNILKAIGFLMQIKGTDVTQIRLQLDALLRIEQGMYYFWIQK